MTRTAVERGLVIDSHRARRIGSPSRRIRWIVIGAIPDTDAYREPNFVPARRNHNIDFAVRLNSTASLRRGLLRRRHHLPLADLQQLEGSVRHHPAPVVLPAAKRSGHRRVGVHLAGLRPGRPRRATRPLAARAHAGTHEPAPDPAPHPPPIPPGCLFLFPGASPPAFWWWAGRGNACSRPFRRACCGAGAQHERLRSADSKPNPARAPAARMRRTPPSSRGSPDPSCGP